MPSAKTFLQHLFKLRPHQCEVMCSRSMYGRLPAFHPSEIVYQLEGRGGGRVISTNKLKAVLAWSAICNKLQRIAAEPCHLASNLTNLSPLERELRSPEFLKTRCRQTCPFRNASLRSAPQQHGRCDGRPHLCLGRRSSSSLQRPLQCQMASRLRSTGQHRGSAHRQTALAMFNARCAFLGVQQVVAAVGGAAAALEH